MPVSLVTPRFRLRPLAVQDVLKDYEAVMTSLDHLQGIFGNLSSWPSPELTLEQEIIDLAWHEKEFQRRSSFTYTVLAPDGSRCLGCVYILPPVESDADAEVFLWVRKDELPSQLDNGLFSTVKQWIKDAWPFRGVTFPGRECELEST